MFIIQIFKDPYKLCITLLIVRIPLLHAFYLISSLIGTEYSVFWNSKNSQEDVLTLKSVNFE